MANTPPEYGSWVQHEDGKWYPPGKPVRLPWEHQPPGTATTTDPGDAEPGPGRSNRTRLRTAGFVVLALAALGVLVALAPDGTSFDVAAARLDQALNEERTEGAPQQQVVNGWATVDMLEIIAHRAVDERVPALLTIGVLAICWAGLTSHWAPRRRPGGRGR